MQVKELISEYSKHLQQAIGLTKNTGYQYICSVQHVMSESVKEAA
jgi:hypothetical protein